jgi:hypothetical protein
MLFASSHSLPFDPEGRIILPEILTEHAQIIESAAFVGLGKSFQIWEPTRFAEHQAMLRERARRQGTRLPPPGGGYTRLNRPHTPTGPRRCELPSTFRFFSTPSSPRWRRATMPSMSTEPLAAAATARRC